METSINFEDSFMLIARAMVKVSGNKLKIVNYIKNIQGSTKKTEEHCLEFDGKKIGNNIEFYVEKSKKYEFKALPDFFIILYKVKYDCPESYRIGSIMLKKIGSEIFEGKILKNWNNLFK